MTRLSITDHRRDSAGLTYVYPVWSRRSGGLSIGINLNPNNACNWRCIYCQVPDLIRGAAPETELMRLEDELRELLASALCGDFFERFAIPADQRVIRDIAISGNGEPTSSGQFDAAIGIVGQACADAVDVELEAGVGGVVGDGGGHDGSVLGCGGKGRRSGRVSCSAATPGAARGGG